MELPIYSDIPTLDRVQHITAVTLRFLFANHITRALWDVVYIVTLSVVFARGLHLLAGSVLARITIIVILAISFFILAFAFIMLVFPRIDRWVVGPPVFGKIGGLPRKTFFTALKCADAIDFKFRPADLDRVREFTRLDRDFTEYILRRSYHALLRSEFSTVEEPADFFQKWSNIWQEKILKVGTKNSLGDTITLDDALAEDNFAFRVEPNKLLLVSSLIAPTVIVFQTIMVILMDRFLSNQINLVTVIQGGLFFSLIVSLLLLNFHAHQNAEIPVIAVPDNMPEEEVKSFADRFRSIGEQPFRPANVKIKKYYVPLVRDYFASILFWIGGVYNTCVSLVFLSLALLLGFILQPASISSALPWYKDMTLGLALIPFGMLAGYYVVFLTLQHARVLLAPIIVGLLAAVLPYALGYLFTGQIHLAQLQNSVWAAGTGIVASLVTVITAHVRTTLEGGKDK